MLTRWVHAWGRGCRPPSRSPGPAAAGAAVPTAHRDRPTSLSASAARPGPARPSPAQLGPAGSRLSHIRMRRRASLARAAAALRAPPGPPPARGPRAPQPEAHAQSHPAAAWGARLHSRGHGGVTRCTLPRGYARHAAMPYSRGPRHTNSPPHPRARAPSLPPVRSHGVTPSRRHRRRPHWNSVTQHHTNPIGSPPPTRRHTQTHLSHTVAHSLAVTNSVIGPHIAHSFTAQCHTLYTLEPSQQSPRTCCTPSPHTS